MLKGLQCTTDKIKTENISAKKFHKDEAERKQDEVTDTSVQRMHKNNWTEVDGKKTKVKVTQVN